jgi:hypothetical protein
MFDQDAAAAAPAVISDQDAAAAAPAVISKQDGAAAEQAYREAAITAARRYIDLDEETDRLDSQFAKGKSSEKMYAKRRDAAVQVQDNLIEEFGRTWAKIVCETAKPS